MTSRHWRRWSWLCVVGSAFYAVGGFGAAQEIGRLYAKRPPPGSAFVRVAITGVQRAGHDGEMNGVSLSGGKDDFASRYRAIRTGFPVELTVNGEAVTEGMTPLPDRFYTVVVTHDRGGWSGHAIDEGQGSTDDLKAELRFFNLVPGCPASLTVANGPTVFEAVASRNFKSRRINPVAAELQAKCGDRTASLELPQLRSGDHYSLFFAEQADKPSLVGQFDQTESYQDQ